MTAQERPQDGAGEARPLNVVGSAGESNPSVDDIPAEALARIRAGVMAEIRRVCPVCEAHGVVTDDDGHNEFCDCRTGQAMAEAEGMGKSW